MLTNQNGQTITQSYDGAKRLLSKSFSTGGSQSFSYDDAGRLLTAQQTMNGQTSLLSYDYNPLSDVINSTQSLDGMNWSVGRWGMFMTM